MIMAKDSSGTVESSSFDSKLACALKHFVLQHFAKINALPRLNWRRASLCDEQQAPCVALMFKT